MYFLFSTTVQVFYIIYKCSICAPFVTLQTSTRQPSPITFYKQFGTNYIVVLMFVESQTVHIYSTCKVCNKNSSVVLLNKKKHIYCCLKFIVYDKLLKFRQSFRITLYMAFQAAAAQGSQPHHLHLVSV